jgi:ribonuclease BN (tRNA processing enzyme)
MKVKLWGVRGSIPVTDPQMEYYGGNTSCMDVWEDGWQLVLDGGSGIQKFNVYNTLENKRIDVLLSHLHLDHIQGLGFFRYFFDPSMEIHIWGPSSSSQTLHSRLSRYLSPPLFPVLIRDLPCKLKLHEIECSTFEIGPFTIQSRYVIHPGPTVGYRISGKKSVTSYIPDHEPALGSHGLISDKKWISGFDLADGADLLFHDAQYTADEYPAKSGWGHSSLDDAGRFASLAGVKHLLLGHHDPSRTDAQLNDLLEKLLQKNNYLFKCEMAKEGTVIEL